MPILNPVKIGETAIATNSFNMRLLLTTEQNDYRLRFLRGLARLNCVLSSCIRALRVTRVSLLRQEEEQRYLRGNLGGGLKKIARKRARQLR